MDFENEEKSDALFSDHYDDDFFKDANGNELVSNNNKASKPSLDSSQNKAKANSVVKNNKPADRFDYLAFGKDESDKSD